MNLGFMTAGFAIANQTEDSFLPSPNGRMIASILHKSKDLNLPAEGMELQQSATLIARWAEGKIAWELPLAAAKKREQIGYGYVDMAWSPDARRLACRIRDQLRIVDASTGNAIEVPLSAGCFRWMKSMTIRVVSRAGSVYQVNSDNGQAQELFAGAAAGNLSGSTSAFQNQISPDGRLFVFLDSQGLAVVDLETRSIRHRLDDILGATFCWWDSNSAACLVAGVQKPQGPQAAPSFDRVLYLYTPATGTFTNLTSNLRALNNWKGDCPRPDGPARVWAKHGGWFLASGTIERNRRSDSEFPYYFRNWACVPRPWKTLCIQDELGPGYTHSQLSPTGDWLLVNKEKHEGYADGDWYAVAVHEGLDGRPHFGTPTMVLSAKEKSWFWSADGTSVVTFSGGKFTTKRVDTAH